MVHRRPPSLDLVGIGSWTHGEAIFDGGEDQMSTRKANLGRLVPAWPELPKDGGGMSVIDLNDGVVHGVALIMAMCMWLAEVGSGDAWVLRSGGIERSSS